MSLTDFDPCEGIALAIKIHKEALKTQEMYEIDDISIAQIFSDGFINWAIKANISIYQLKDHFEEILKDYEDLYKFMKI